MKRTPERVESGHFLAKHNVSVVVHADQVEHRLAKVNADCTDTHIFSPRCGFVLPSSPDAARFKRQTILLIAATVHLRSVNTRMSSVYFSADSTRARYAKQPVMR